MNQKVRAFYVIDGAIYIYILNGASEKEIYEGLLEFKEDFKKNLKVRLVLEEYDKNFIQGILENFLSSINNPSTISFYNTNFFGLNKDEVLKLNYEYSKNQLQISNFSDNFKFQEVSIEDEANLVVVKNFIENSFGIDFIQENGRFMPVPNASKEERIKSNFSKGAENPNTKLFLISTKKDELVGCFALVNVEGDIQLESVCGLAKLDNLYNGKKLPVLMGSVLEILTTYEYYKNFQSFSFTNSKEKVSQLYKSLNFKINPQRYGFVVEKI